jgi:opacity protein-like surface antigen
MLARSTLAIALAVAAAPAFAGGFAAPVATPAPAVPVAVAPVAPASDWTGFYAGGQLGYGNLALDITDGQDSLEVGDGSGALLGVHAGYMRDFGRFVLGGEIDYDLASIDIEQDGEIGDGPGTLGSVDSVARAKVRLGFDAGRFLPYVTAGVARASLSYDVAGAEAAFDDTVSGRVFGLGVVYAVNDRLSLGVEALRHDFDGPGDSGAEFDFETQVDTVSVRASWRF